MGRAPCCDKVGMKKGRWTSEEDDLLTKYIQAHGEGSWRSLPKNAGLLRCGKSCRLRWINYLRADLKRGNISSEEEDIIVKLHSTLGNRWSLIAGHLPGRTDNEIKNYWNSHLSRKVHTFRRPIIREIPQPELPMIADSGLAKPKKAKIGKTSRGAMKKNKFSNYTKPPRESREIAITPLTPKQMSGSENLSQEIVPLPSTPAPEKESLSCRSIEDELCMDPILGDDEDRDQNYYGNHTNFENVTMSGPYQQKEVMLGSNVEERDSNNIMVGSISEEMERPSGNSILCPNGLDNESLGGPFSGSIDECGMLLFFNDIMENHLTIGPNSSPGPNLQDPEVALSSSRMVATSEANYLTDPKPNPNSDRNPSPSPNPSPSLEHLEAALSSCKMTSSVDTNSNTSTHDHNDSIDQWYSCSPPMVSSFDNCDRMDDLDLDCDHLWDDDLFSWLRESDCDQVGGELGGDGKLDQGQLGQSNIDREEQNAMVAWLLS